MNTTRTTCIYCDILLATVEADDELEAEGHTPQLDGAEGDEVRAAAVTIRTARTYLATDHEGADCPHRELIGE
jgi:hypothetical protein